MTTNQETTMPDKKPLTDSEKLHGTQIITIMLYQRIIERSESLPDDHEQQPEFQQSIKVLFQVLEAWRVEGLLHDSIQAALEEAGAPSNAQEIIV
jgi:hypothetical protein